MNVRRLVLDVDKAISMPTIPEIAQAITKCAGVEAVNITVGEIDVETVGMDITIEGQNLNYEDIETSIENTGAVVHSIDQIVCGDRLIDDVRRRR